MRGNLSFFWGTGRGFWVSVQETNRKKNRFKLSFIRDFLYIIHHLRLECFSKICAKGRSFGTYLWNTVVGGHDFPWFSATYHICNKYIPWYSRYKYRPTHGATSASTHLGSLSCPVPICQDESFYCSLGHSHVFLPYHNQHLDGIGFDEKNVGVEQLFFLKCLKMDLDVSENRGYPKIIHFNRVLHYHPFWGTLFLETPRWIFLK